MRKYPRTCIKIIVIVVKILLRTSTCPSQSGHFLHVVVHGTLLSSSNQINGCFYFLALKKRAPDLFLDPTVCDVVPSKVCLGHLPVLHVPVF